MTKNLVGIGASNGIAIAKVFKLIEPKIVVEDNKIEDISSEIEKLNQAVKKAEKDIIELKEIAFKKLGEEKAAIFEAHNQILQDPSLLDEAKQLVETEKYNIAYAISQVAKKYVDMFSNMDDPYFKERASDIHDVTSRLIKYLLNIPVLDLATINQEVIIVAEDLTPSQTAQLNPEYVKGFACDMGGRTSHAAIMARSLEIPAVVGLKDITHIAEHNDEIIIDGKDGVVLLHPSSEDVLVWKQKREKYINFINELQSFVDKPTVSLDGYDKFVLEGNIGSPKDVNGVLKYGGEGIGLFRSEFLYMDNDHFPTEEEQFNEYKKVLQEMNNKPVIIRTLDIGGDKTLSYFQFPKELNPFLGYRAIRYV